MYLIFKEKEINELFELDKAYNLLVVIMNKYYYQILLMF